MYKYKLEEMFDFLELLRCSSYDDVFILKKRIGDERFKRLEERYESLKQEYQEEITGSSLEVLEQERTIDFSQLTKNHEWEEICFILQLLLSPDVETILKMKVPTTNYFLVQLYQEYVQFLKAEKVKKIPILLHIKVTSFI